MKRELKLSLFWRESDESDALSQTCWSILKISRGVGTTANGFLVKSWRRSTHNAQIL